MSSFGAMGLSGIGVDPETGLPLESHELKKERAKENIARLVDAQGLSSELRGEPGQQVLRYVLDVLEARIIEVLQKDPVAVSFVRLLQVLNYQGNVARKQAVDMIRRQLGQDTPDWILSAAQ